MVDSESVVQKINDLSLASMTNGGVNLWNEFLWDKIDNLIVSHTPRHGIRPINPHATIGDTANLMINEVHDNMVELGFIKEE